MIVGMLVSDARAEVAVCSRQCSRSNLHAWWDLVERLAERQREETAAHWLPLGSDAGGTTGHVEEGNGEQREAQGKACE